MSILSSITTARRTETIDAKEIVKFVNKSTLEIFGPNCKEVGKLFEFIEKSILSITLEDQYDGRILAQASFNDYPNVYNVPTDSWEKWLRARYEASKMNSLNTLFMHFFASQQEYSTACAQEIIKSAFKAVPECHYILLCVPLSKMPEPALSNIFNEMKKNPHKDTSSTIHDQAVVFVTTRDKHIPVLHIRESNVNDNDDLVPLLNSYTDLLKATYGDFYVAEMIEAQNHSNKCLTSEAEGFGMGFMAITKDVNVQLLNECFELRPFHGLCKPHQSDILNLSPPSSAKNKSSQSNHEENRNEDENDYQEAKLSDEAEDRKTPSKKVSIDAPPQFIHRLSEDIGILAEEVENEFSGTRNYSSQDDDEYDASKSIKFIPKYYGEPNAFSIQLFCIEEKYDSRSMDFLPKAFELFPDRDYCIITLPPNVPEFSLIQNFLRVTPRETNKLNQELYVFHRAGVVKSFEIREANRENDFAQVERIVHNIKSKESILRDLTVYQKSRKDPNGIDVKAYVAEVMGRVVGIAIFRQEEDIEYLRSHYNIEDFILYTHHKREEHAHLNHFALIPIFSFLTKYFIREIFRKSHLTSIYYPIYPEYASEELSQQYSLTTAMNFMVPVRRRTQIEYNIEKLGENSPSERVLKPKYNYALPCALNHINRKLLLEPKVAINLRIVVVGASDLGLSFLEKLAFSPHLRFNNLVLVSTDGLPGALPPDSLRDNMRAHKMNFDMKDHAAMSLRSWVNVIIGKMTSIDRRRKHIVINGQTVLPYDHLILCTGEQYYNIAPHNARVYNAYIKQEVKPFSGRPLFDESPSNMFVLNNEYDAESLLAIMEKHNLHKYKESIVVYGFDLNALCAIQSLIKCGIDSNRFIIVCEKNYLSCFNNPYVSSKISKQLEELEIKVYESMEMIEWNDGTWRSGQFLNKIHFASNEKKSSHNHSHNSLTVNCCLLLCYYKKDVDYTTFMACNKCHLVYDGRLVVDNEFHTNDSCIRAAGRMTKYKRSYYVDSWSHNCFNQKEIGTDLAIKMLELVDPVYYVEKDPNEKTDSARLASNEPDEKVLIELYKKPIINYAILPGNYYYLHVTKPGILMTYDEEKNEREELVTNTENGYFRIHLNKHKCVQTITCLSKKKFNAVNLSKLYGLNEQFLNKLQLKYDNKQIKDFFVYFNDNWCAALYHDRFEELCKEIRDISIDPNNGIKSAHELLKDLIDRDLIITKEQSNKISQHFVNSNTRSLIEKRLLNYLNYNINHLSMYAKPDMV